MNVIDWISGKRRHHVPIEGDAVYPTHFMDNKKAYEKMSFCSAWKFDDVLDAEMLHDALCRTLEIGDWRKLGGRLRRGSSGKLELHIPVKFTPERPAVSFSRKVFDVKIREHPLASRIPENSDGRAFFPLSDDAITLLTRPDTPTVIDDYLSRDEAVLSLHIASFVDGTIVSLTWPHHVTDVMGVNAIVRAWSLVLAGKEEDVLPLKGARDDILYEIPEREDPAIREESVLDHTHLTGLRLFLLIFYFLIDAFFGPKLEPGLFRISKQTLENMREGALSDIAEQRTAEGQTPWISESDALLAALTKTLSESQNRPRPIIVLNPYDIRGRLPEMSEPKVAYVQSGIGDSLTTITSTEAASSIGHIALKLRQSLQLQIKPEQITANLRSLRKLWDSGQDPFRICGPHNAVFFGWSNWTKAKLCLVPEFGPAVLKRGDASIERPNAPGSPSLFYSMPMLVDATRQNGMACLGKDHDGNIWLVGFFTGRFWKNAARTMENFQSLPDQKS